MQDQTKAAPSSADREIAATRLFNATRDLVFAAWTDQSHISNWWGPRGFTTTTHEMDVRPGGVWRFTMHGPDGRDYANKIIYLEVQRPERLVYKHAGEAGTEPINFHVTVTFAARGDKTELSMRMIFESAADRNRVAEEYGAVEGLHHTMDRLGEQLEHRAPAQEEPGRSRPFIISREFDAPRELVWRAWTEHERLVQWWGPKGFKMVTAKLDLRPSGLFHYCMTSPDGFVLWGRFVFREIMPPERLVFVSSFSNEKAEITRAPFADVWPLEMLGTVTLEEVAGKTKLTLQSIAINANEIERRTFEDGFTSMKGGWTGTLDQLEAFLAKK